VGQPFLRVRAGGLALRWLLSPIALALLCGVCVYWAVVGKDDVAAENAAEDGEAEADDDVGSSDEATSEQELVSPR
jgi:hypothetical protein